MPRPARPPASLRARAHAPAKMLVLAILLAGIPPGTPPLRAGTGTGPATSPAAQPPAGLTAPSAVAGVAPANAKCPVLVDEDVDTAIWVEYEGRKVFFCCRKCRKAFLAEPARYRETLPRTPAAPDLPGSTAGSHAGSTASAGASGSDLRSPGGDGRSPMVPARAEALPSWLRLVRWLGRFHPVVVHFPIALVLAAAAAEIAGMLRRRPRFLDAARLALVAGAVGSAVSALLGWAAWNFATIPAESAAAMFSHRWLGTASAVVCLVAALAADAAPEGRTGGRGRLVYRVLLFASAILIGATGHFGGLVVYGTAPFAW